MLKLNKDAVLLSKDIIQDVGNGLVSLIGLVDKFEADGFPASIGPINVAAKFTAIGKATSNVYPVTMSVEDEDGKHVNTKDIDMDLPLTEGESKQKTGLLVTITELQVAKAGDYRVVITHEAKEIGDVEFRVVEETP